jgi:hypothetical protein
VINATLAPDFQKEARHARTSLYGCITAMQLWPSAKRLGRVAAKPGDDASNMPADDVRPLGARRPHGDDCQSACARYALQTDVQLRRRDQRAASWAGDAADSLEPVHDLYKVIKKPVLACLRRKQNQRRPQAGAWVLRLVAHQNMPFPHFLQRS